MYAVFEDGSRQYRVTEGGEVVVDYREAEIGSEVTFDRVLLVVDAETAKIGQPTVAGAKIVAEVVEHPTVKTRVQKFRRRKNYKRLVGHRQPFTRLKVRSITG
ncbi:MAG: 50S ribosomal protein L21 [Gemmataceae bacterium]